MKTIKQIADAIGVDKQRVYRYIKNNRISEVHHDAGVMWYDEVVESLINQHFKDIHCISDVHHEAHQTTSSDTVIDTVISMLKKELDIKNEQIKDLNARLAESNAALVIAQQSAQAAQLLYARTIRNQLTNDCEETTVLPESTSLFSRIFKHKSLKH